MSGQSNSEHCLVEQTVEGFWRDWGSKHENAVKMRVFETRKRNSITVNVHRNDLSLWSKITRISSRPIWQLRKNKRFNTIEHGSYCVDWLSKSAQEEKVSIPFDVILTRNTIKLARCESLKETESIAMQILWLLRVFVLLDFVLVFESGVFFCLCITSQDIAATQSVSDSRTVLKISPQIRCATGDRFACFLQAKPVVVIFHISVNKDVNRYGVCEHIQPLPSTTNVKHDWGRRKEISPSRTQPLWWKDLQIDSV
jgi:hypothetical protein